MQELSSRRDVSASFIFARLDRLTVWSLPALFIGVIGVGFLFTFFDIFDINVSFIQTCSNIVPGCSPMDANNYLGLPVVINLAGYVVGTLILSPISDRIGRKHMLMITMLLSGLGSLLTAVVNQYGWFVLARGVTGTGIGADLAIVNAYINEVAPRQQRARYTSLIFVMSAVGAFLGIWLGLLLTTPKTPFPLGLPFALASAQFGYGWRIMYLIGGLLALVGVLLRVQLPESPRWLVSQGRLEEANLVVANMEMIAAKHGPLAPVHDLGLAEESQSAMPYSEIFKNSLYVRRTILLMLMWTFSYVTVYAYASGFTTLLSSLKYPPPEAGLIASVGTVGFVLCAIVAAIFGEHLERKLWMPISALLTLIGGFLVASSGANLALAMIGSMVTFFGFNLWIPIAYAWSTEHYPTRARTTGFALVDGIGHLGGGIGILVIAPLIPSLGVMPSFLIINGGLVAGAVLALFGIRTRGKRLEEISP
ncbi:MFS transporter [Sulfoacidibacillus thermotolerans]|uniref:MFS transporter n=1 Tax=Sulfoacidibacillus thermotolerans TaxID=1765684 RepID=A0A2U3D762_SULT2|nr:MFS transporter [Sulfoacidibacillus thermotolerans]PWI57124.1 MFS transporter [Sulfoacidibacillus thermotolerans]